MAIEHQVEARPRRWLTPVVLVLLKEETSYGYELMGRIQEDFGFEQINPGSVYRVLRQMDNEGLCTSVWDLRDEEGGEGPPPCRMYAITDEGEAYLEAWAKACEEYHRLMSQFSKVYKRRPPRSSE